MSAWLYLSIAIVAEVIATSALNASAGFTRLLPSVVVVVGYVVAFLCLAQCLKAIPVGIAYAIWSGVGIVLISLIGWIVFRQSLDAAAMLGMGLIIAGVIVINVFSRTVAH
ncbi:MAG: SMR family transporter [Panacagrimonas sp.]